MGSEGSTNSSSNTDMYSRVKLDGRVCGSGISSKRECADYMVKRKAVVLGGNDKFPSRKKKMARLSDLAKQEAVMSCGNINRDGERRDCLVDDLIEVGDMVWAKVESHRWWPGQVFDEAFACTSVCRTKKKGCVLVAFFGDDSYGWFERGELIPFDPHFTEKSKQSNTLNFLTAVEEAQDELNKRAALGLTCLCRSPNNFQPTHVPGFSKVDISGFDNGSVYSLSQIERARNDFLPINTLKFLRKLALMPRSGMTRDVEGMKDVARLVAYRRAVFEEIDETIPPEFLVQPVCSGSSLVLSDLQEGWPPASQRVKRGTKKTIGTGSLRTPPNTVAFGNVRDHSGSSSKPPKKMLSSGEKSIKKATALKETQPLTGEKKATKQTPLEVKGHEKMVGPTPTEPTRVAMKLPRQSPLASVAETKAKKMQSSGQKPVEKPIALDAPKPLTLEKKATNQKKPLEVQGDEKMVGPTLAEPTRVAMKLPRQSPLASVGEMKAKKMRSSGQKPVEKPTALDETRPLTLEKKATGQTPLEVQGDGKMVGPTEPTRVVMKIPHRSPLTSVAEMRAKKMQSSGQKPVEKPTALDETRPLTLENKATGQTSLGVQGGGKMVGPSEPTRVVTKFPHRSPLSSGEKAKKMLSSGEKPIEKPTALNETKSLTLEKKAATQTPLEVQGDEQMMGPTEPTRVVMKFPPGSPLPSVSEMKAKFARFGKLDELGMRVFWNTSTCQVVFKKVSSAQAAYEALQNKVLFGNTNAKYSLQASKVSFPSGSGEASKPVMEESRNAIPKLKSILKKPADVEHRFVKSIPEADTAINKHYQEEARRNESIQTTSSTSTGVDISEPMKILLSKCFDIVADHGFMF